MKRVLVAGGAGFIGSHLCEELLKQGSEVFALDSLVTGARENLLSLMGQPRFHFVQGDICDLDITRLPGPFDEIYNLASPASPIDFVRIPTEILRAGSLGHENLLRLARRDQARILFGSTSEVYGDPLEHPQAEDYRGNVNCIGERSCYDEAKRFGEALSMAYQRQFAVDICLVRIFNTYGPRMRLHDGRIIPNFFRQALSSQALTIHGHGEQTRSFCFVDDLVEGLILAMESGRRGPYNLGSDEEVSIGQVAGRINQLCANTSPHLHLPLPKDDPKQRRPDLGRVSEELGWRPSTDLDEGLKKTMTYFASLKDDLGRVRSTPRDKESARPMVATKGVSK